MAKRKIKRARTTKLHWAIETGLASPRYIAAYYRSRRTARSELKRIKGAETLPKARAVRVAVTITTIGRG